MPRPATTTIRDLVPLLRSRVPVSATEMAGMLGVNRTTIVRVLGDFGDDLVVMGGSRRTRYALRRNVRGTGNRWPVFRIDEGGQAQEWAVVEALQERLWRVNWAGEAPAWAEHFSTREGLWNGFPFFLGDARPQGFLGRSIARRVSRSLQVPDDPRMWSDDDILVFLEMEGEDLPGDLVVGEACLRRALGRALSGVPTQESRYPELAGLVASGIVGSSAGGEQPKFLATSEVHESTRSDVLVKFSPPLAQATGRRWADLLLAECHAHAVLERVGLGMPSARIVDLDGRRFLEIQRFDRTPGSGRRGVVSLESLHAAASGVPAREWTEAVTELERAGLVDGAAVVTTQRLQAFGELIGNTDMHFGNLAFWLEDSLPFRVVPAYDMLPMLWAPGPQGELSERRFSPDPPVPAALAAWREAAGWAAEYWQNLSDDARLSREFAGFAREAILTVDRLRRFVGG